MTLLEIQEQVMFQTNNDADDLGDFTPHLTDYVNDGYDQIARVWDHKHVPSEDYPRLTEDTDEPLVPEWMHRYITDWATWLVYRNGNPQKQQRGNAFRMSFLDLLSRIADEGGKDGYNSETGELNRYKEFRNIPV